MLPLIDDAFVAAHVSPTATREAIAAAFRALATGRASIQPRSRIECGDFRLSTMGGIWLDAGLAAVKTYGTVQGQFDFLCNLFDARSGAPLAVLQANELTRVRTPALSTLAALQLAPTPRRLALFGAGVQGRAHLDALLDACPFEEVAVVNPHDVSDWCRSASARWGRPVRQFDADPAVERSDVVVTTTRSKKPVFDGRRLQPGASVIAVGTSLPTGTELDDTTLSRAARVIVEWKPQSLVEAGEVVIGQRNGALDAGRVVDLVELAEQPWRTAPDDIVVFKTVGVGLTDLAAASLAWAAWNA